jgi:hypothetical protein
VLWGWMQSLPPVVKQAWTTTLGLVDRLVDIIYDLVPNNISRPVVCLLLSPRFCRRLCCSLGPAPPLHPCAPVPLFPPTTLPCPPLSCNKWRQHVMGEGVWARRWTRLYGRPSSFWCWGLPRECLGYGLPLPLACLLLIQLALSHPPGVQPSPPPHLVLTHPRSSLSST